MTSYDAWLEAPYQRMCDDDSRYEAALEVEEQLVWAELEQLTIKDLLTRHSTFQASVQDILAENLPNTAPLPRTTKYRWSLEEVLTALSFELAEERLAAKPVEYDGPEPDDFDQPDFDRDCDYWNRTK